MFFSCAIDIFQKRQNLKDENFEMILLFIYSEKATKFFKISTVDLTDTTKNKSKLVILQIFVFFSQKFNFKDQ
jgi:hypothetical protein